MHPIALPDLDSGWSALAYAATIYLLMLLLAALVVRRGQPKALTASAHGRVGSLDGFRGILALGVLVHHHVISYVYLNTGVWALGENPVINHLGQTAVTVFFMITGFLFTIKTIDVRIDWPRFYLNRFARLAPLYFVVVLVVFSIVLVLSDGVLHESPLTLATELVHWLSFVYFDRPDFNGYPDTWMLIAGVNWSLRFEVMFYLFGVPALFCLNRLVSRPVALSVTILVFLAIVIYRQPFDAVRTPSFFALQFLIGTFAAYLYTFEFARRVIEAPYFSWLGAAAACCLPAMLDANSTLAIVCASIVFLAVVGNATIFGLLKTRPALWLGDVSYGIYLIHGLVLWTGFRWIRHWVAVDRMTPIAFVSSGAVMACVTVLLASFSYLRVELPAMRYAKARFRPRVAPAALVPGAARG